jgi:hypothetical protein
MPMHIWIAGTANGASRRLKPGLAMMLSFIRESEKVANIDMLLFTYICYSKIYIATKNTMAGMINK